MISTPLDKLGRFRPVLPFLAVLGFLFINCPFLYFAIFNREVYDAGMSNGLALVFIVEAFLLLIFFAVLIAKLGWKRPGWFFFVCMSLLGSLAFSIPLQLYLMSRNLETPTD